MARPVSSQAGEAVIPRLISVAAPTPARTIGRPRFSASARLVLALLICPIFVIGKVASVSRRGLKQFPL